MQNRDPMKRLAAAALAALATLPALAAEPALRDPDAYAEGATPGPLPPPMPEHRFGSLLVDRLEASHADGRNEAAYDLEGWYGGDYDRLVLKAEGAVRAGKSEEARTELLWGHAIAPYWDTQLGVRRDGGPGPDRTWLAFGVEGIAPYWFELEATAYVGEGGRTALRLAGRYEALLTQRLVVEPRLDASAYGRGDPARELGAGLAELTAGVRLRYEIRRELAPYVGVERAFLFGDTADLARASGTPTAQTRAVAGIRFWF